MAEREQQLVLAGEVRVERAAGEAGLIADVLDRRTLDALAGEDDAGRVEQAFAGRGAASDTGRDGRSLGRLALRSCGDRNRFDTLLYPRHYRIVEVCRTPLYALGRWAFQHHRRVIAAWMLVIVVAGAAAITFGGNTRDEFNIPGTESQTAIDALDRTFPQLSGASAYLVTVAPEGRRIDDAASRELVDDAIDADQGGRRRQRRLLPVRRRCHRHLDQRGPSRGAGADPADRRLHRHHRGAEGGGATRRRRAREGRLRPPRSAATCSPTPVRRCRSSSWSASSSPASCCG